MFVSATGMVHYALTILATVQHCSIQQCNSRGRLYQPIHSIVEKAPSLLDVIYVPVTFQVAIHSSAVILKYLERAVQH